MKDGAKASSLLDRFGHFGVPFFDAKAQIFDIRAPMLKDRFSIPDLRC